MGRLTQSEAARTLVMFALAIVLIALPIGEIQWQQASPASAHRIAARHGPSFNALPGNGSDLACVETSRWPSKPELAASWRDAQPEPQITSSRDEHPVYRIRPPPSSL